jgi:hypothetical protein
MPESRHGKLGTDVPISLGYQGILCFLSCNSGLYRVEGLVPSCEVSHEYQLPLSHLGLVFWGQEEQSLSWQGNWQRNAFESV